MTDATTLILAAADVAHAWLALCDAKAVRRDARGRFARSGGGAHPRAHQVPARVRGPEHAERLKLQHRERVEHAHEIRSERRGLRREHATERRRLVRGQQGEAGKLERGHVRESDRLNARHQRELSRSRNPSSLDRRHATERADMATDHAQARGDLHAEHATDRRNLRSEHREATQDQRTAHREGIAELRRSQRADMAETLRDVLDTRHYERDQAGHGGTAIGLIPASKSNPCHDADGRFCSTGHGGGSTALLATRTTPTPQEMADAVHDYLGVEPVYGKLEVLDEATFDSRFSDESSGVTGGVAAFRTNDGDIFIKRGYEADALHELVHAAGMNPDKSVSEFVNEGMTQWATEKIASKNNWDVRGTYSQEVAFVERYIAPSSGMTDRELASGYAKAPSKGKFLGESIWKAHGDAFSDQGDWGKNPREAIVTGVGQSVGHNPHLSYLVDEVGVGKSVRLDRSAHALATKDVPPLQDAGPDEEPEGEGNEYGLPDGEDIEKLLKVWFARQAAEVLGTLPTIGEPLPDALPDIEHHDEAMGRAFTPLISSYWDKAGGAIRAKIGLEPEAWPSSWNVVDPHVRDKIRTSVLAFCQSTNQSTSVALGDALQSLRREMEAGVVDEGEGVTELTKRVQRVFDGLSKSHARMIGQTEASRAVHLAQEASVEGSNVVQGAEWLLSSNACSFCHKIHDEVGRVKLGDSFAEIGSHPYYKNIRVPPGHPRCRCSVTWILTPDMGGPEDVEWGEPLVDAKEDED